MIIIAITYEPEKARVNLQILSPGPHTQLEVIEALAAARLQFLTLAPGPRPGPEPPEDANLKEQIAERDARIAERDARIRELETKLKKSYERTGKDGLQ